MSLKKIGDNHKLKMHDQLTDLGREIVHQENRKAPMYRSRLWTHEEALEALQRNKEIEKIHVEALRLDRCISGTKITAEQFEKLPNLRFLQVDAGNPIGDSKSSLPKLRWLMCTGSSIDMATGFHLEKLVIFDLSSSGI